MCEKCGRDLSIFGSMDYEEKLILGLSNPITSRRMLVIEILGRIKSDRAIPILCRMLEESKDIFEKEQIIRALKEIGTREALECLSLKGYI